MLHHGLYEQVINNALISELPEYVKPKNVDLMFFSLEPHRFFPYAQIDVVQFPDDLGGDEIIEKTFRGPLTSAAPRGTAVYTECCYH